MNFSFGGGIGGGVKTNFSIGGGVNIGGGFGASTQSSNVVRTTTVTTSNQVNQQNTVNMNAQIEANIRAQYQEKLNAWELKYNESQATINDLTKRLKIAESTIVENNNKFTTEKNNYEFHLNRIRTERNEKTNVINRLEQELNSFRSSSSSYTKVVSEYEVTIRTLTEKLSRFEEDAQQKKDRMAKLEGDLIKAQNDLVAEDLDDQQMLDTINRQKELITKMQKEIAEWVEENKRDDAQILQYENVIKARDEEIALLRRQLEDAKQQINISTTIDITQITTCEVYIELETKYTFAIAERDNLQRQLENKNNIIRDLEARNKSAGEKYSQLQKSFNDIRVQIEMYEGRELEYRRQIDEYVLNINNVNMNFSMQSTKITAYEEMIAAKDNRIRGLAEQLREKDLRLNELKNASQKSTEDLNNTRQQLEDKLREIVEWKAEDARDNSQIAELLAAVENQNRIIKGWEEENNRDDQRIAELEKKCADYETLIENLRSVALELRLKCNDYTAKVFSFSVVDTTETGNESITRFRQEVETSSAYLQLQERVNDYESQIKQLRDEINQYRTDLQNVINEKSLALAEAEGLRKEINILNSRAEKSGEFKLEFESRYQKQTSEVEVYQSNFVKATNRVDGLKVECSTINDEINALFSRIEELALTR